MILRKTSGNLIKNDLKNYKPYIICSFDIVL